MDFWRKSLKDHIQIYIQLFAWMILAYTLFFQYLLTCDCNPPVFFWVKQCLLMISLIALYYIHVQVLIPKWIIHKKYPTYLLLTIGTVLVHILFSRMADRLIIRVSKGIYRDIDFSGFDLVLAQ